MPIQRRIPKRGFNNINRVEYRVFNLGQIELRYSARQGAAWGRFEGYGSLDHLARQRRIEIQVEVARESDGLRSIVRESYCFDYHWCDLLVLGAGRMSAAATVIADGDPIADLPATVRVLAGALRVIVP